MSGLVIVFVPGTAGNDGSRSICCRRRLFGPPTRPALSDGQTEEGQARKQQYDASRCRHGIRSEGDGFSAAKSRSKEGSRAAPRSHHTDHAAIVFRDVQVTTTVK